MSQPKLSIVQEAAKPVDESFLRLVVIDFPKLQLDNPAVFSIFGELIKCRQSNFLRTSDSFLVIDKHDLVGTHFLVFDTRNLFTPKLVAGFRITYEERSTAHNLQMPILSLLAHCPPQATKDYEEFRCEKGQSIQFNTLFIEPGYTYSQSALRLSDILFFCVCAYIRRLGFNHYVGATNDRLKTDRWMKRAGCYNRNTYAFKHPEVSDPHTLFFIESINDEWLRECFMTYEHYWKNAYEFIPDQIARCSFMEVIQGLRKSTPPSQKIS